MIGRQCAVAFGHRSLANVITNETSTAARGGKCGEGFAGVHLTGWRDRFDPRGAAHVCPTVVPPARDWIVKLVNWSSVQRDPQI